MSRAFVKEDVETTDALPDRPVSPHRNFVTPTGLARIEAELATVRARLSAATAAGERQAVSTFSRDVRYWTERRASAELLAPPHGDAVRFGSTVTIERVDGRRQTFRIVGEDEADPTKGSLSYVAPLARALLGKQLDDEVEFMGEPIVVVSVGAQERQASTSA